MSETEPTVARQEFKPDKTRLRLFALLIICAVVPQLPFIAKGCKVPDQPVQSVQDLYSTVMSIPDSSTVLVQTDWTNSTRAESGGQFEALARILMRKNCKLAIYSMGDFNAPRVAMDDIMTLNEERKKAGEHPYMRWTDFVSIGFFPNAEGATNAMAANLRSAWSGKKDIDPKGQQTDVFQSPVLQKINTVQDVPLIVVITPSNTFNVLVERLSGKVPIVAVVTGVMGPESQVYYASKQIQGLGVGLRSVYDLEWLMENGIDIPGPDQGLSRGHKPVPNFPGKINFGKGKLYYPTLHVVLTLMIVAVIVGNILMFRDRRRKPK